MSKLQFIIPLNTSLGPVTSRCNRVVGDPWKVFQPCPYNFRFDEDWDVQLPESPLPLLRVGVLAVWFDPCSNNSAAFDDRNALISITRAITRGDRRFAFQDGGQAFCDSIASWVYDLVPCFPDQAKSIWRPKARTWIVYQIENYFPNIELFCFPQFMPFVEMVKMFEDLSYLYRQLLSSPDG